ncbi:forkhead box protein Q1 [Misgurnus anguillicaudatus]|uniref:forkhead box protein Q1 n=1 Tax=Misgurnus anguillicaudatus TaxID=75329 RepID=UPI003CCF36E0
MSSEMQREHSDMVARRKYKRYSKQKLTYLGLIAYAIQNAPEKRLTFCELMNAIGALVDGDRKGLENNIRVCLSLNDCFVKVPINPECPNARRNFWKVDGSKITPKMLRRHFSSMRDILPDIHENTESTSAKNPTVNNSKGTEAKKFTSSFSIESILRRECSAPTRPTYFTSSYSNVASADNGWSCKRKAWDYPDQTECASFRRSHSHFTFPPYSQGQMNDRCISVSPPSKRICPASELSYNYFDNIRQFTSNSVTWAYP